MYGFLAGWRPSFSIALLGQSWMMTTSFLFARGAMLFRNIWVLKFENVCFDRTVLCNSKIQSSNTSITVYPQRCHKHDWQNKSRVIRVPNPSYLRIFIDKSNANKTNQCFGLVSAVLEDYVNLMMPDRPGTDGEKRSHDKVAGWVYLSNRSFEKTGPSDSS